MSIVLSKSYSWNKDVINENITVSENLNENEIFKLFASVTDYMTDERSLVLQIDKNVH